MVVRPDHCVIGTTRRGRSEKVLQMTRRIPLSFSNTIIICGYIVQRQVYNHMRFLRRRSDETDSQNGNRPSLACALARLVVVAGKRRPTDQPTDRRAMFNSRRGRRLTAATAVVLYYYNIKPTTGTRRAENKQHATSVDRGRERI